MEQASAQTVAPIAGQALRAQIRIVPTCADADHGRELVADFCVRAAKAEGCEDICAAIAADERLSAFIAGVFANAPFLRDLAMQDPERLARVLESDPEAIMAAIERDLAVFQPADEAALSRRLRQAKQEAALAIALADIAGVWPVMQVTRALTRLADATLSAAIRFLLADLAARGRYTPKDPADPAWDSGWIILAMGKYGAGELNYSSDIDLIVLFDPERANLPEGVEPAMEFVRATKRLVKIMQERTADGYVFRTDLRLRPDPGATPPAIAMENALIYYESMGQNWERAALIKARPCAGDIVAGETFLREIVPFIWRKSLDFAAIADVHSMKRQIHAHKGHGEIAVAGHNVKLGRGGIREIEFFVQTQQLIAGGRNPELRQRGTLTMLDLLVEAKWVDETTRDELNEAYCFLRNVEHRIQMLNDEQTHTLPDDDEGLARIAALMGLENRAAFDTALRQRLRTVQGHYAELFEAEPELSSELGNLVFTGDDDDPGTLETLSGLGYKRPSDTIRIVRSWHFGRYPAMRSAKARERLTELHPALIDAFGRTDNPDSALAAFDRFLAALPMGVQLFSLLHANPHLLALLATVMGEAPRLADIVSKRARVLDAMLDPAFFDAMPKEEDFTSRLQTSLGEARSYEETLDRMRIFAQEQQFLIGVRLLSDTLAVGQAGRAYARLAQVIVRNLLDAVKEHLAEAHGVVPGGEVAVVAMGKLGSLEMTPTSDLDLILLYDFPDDVNASDGGRALAPSQYYIRLTQRLLAALSAPTAEGTLYEVDFRLRPSGNAGPLATRLTGFAEYQRDKAWTWEHMALTRARVIAGDAAISERIASVIDEALCKPRDDAALRRDVASMRARIEAEKGSKDRWALKEVSGGLIDIEFIAQYLQLAHAAEHRDILAQTCEVALGNAAQAGVLSADDAEILIPAVRLYQALMQILRLSVAGKFDPAKAPRGVLDLLARASNMPDFERLDAHLEETQASVRAAFERIVGPVVRGEG